MPVHDFDLLVIGSGPGGQKAAIAAAKLGQRVAVVERPEMLGGVCLQTGTIPSKTLREAVLYLTGLDQRETAGSTGITRVAAFVVAPALDAATLTEELRRRVDPVFLPRPLVFCRASTA